MAHTQALTISDAAGLITVLFERIGTNPAYKPTNRTILLATAIAIYHRGLHDLPSTVVELANYFETTTVYMNSRLKYMTTENILGYDAVPYAGRGGVTRHYKISDAISQVVIDRRVATPT